MWLCSPPPLPLPYVCVLALVCIACVQSVVAYLVVLTPAMGPRMELVRRPSPSPYPAVFSLELPHVLTSLLVYGVFVQYRDCVSRPSPVCL